MTSEQVKARLTELDAERNRLLAEPPEDAKAWRIWNRDTGRLSVHIYASDDPVNGKYWLKPIAGSRWANGSLVLDASCELIPCRMSDGHPLQPTPDARFFTKASDTIATDGRYHWRKYTIDETLEKAWRIADLEPSRNDHIEMLLSLGYLECNRTGNPLKPTKDAEYWHRDPDDQGRKYHRFAFSGAYAWKLCDYFGV